MKSTKKLNIVKKPLVPNALVPNVQIPSFRLFHFDILNMTREELEGASDDASTGSDESNKIKKKRIDDKLFICQMYGINERGETASIFIDDFEPFFYVKVEDNWTVQMMNDFVREIKQILGDYYKESLVKWDLVDSQKLYGFAAGKRSKFVKLVFKNTVAFNKAKNLWYIKNHVGNRALCYYKTKQGKRAYNQNCLPILVGTELYEANLPPLLRYFHINSVWPNGWVSVSGPRSTVNVTSCKYEYIASQKNVIAMPDKETSVPYKIMSFDIEAGSSHGDFPLPKKTYKRLAMNIMDSFIKQGIDDAALAKTGFKSMILSAFGAVSCEGVDIVYPKEPQNKKMIEQLIEYVLNTTISELTSKQTSDVARLLTLDAMFDKMKSANKFVTTNDEVEVENVDDDEEEEAEPTEDAEEDSEEEEEVIVVKAPVKKAKPVIKTTIIDILLSDKYDRDDKIKQLDELLTTTFPQLEGDPVTMIGSTFVKYGESEPYLNHCITLGGCAPIPGAVVEAVQIVNGNKVDAEKEVLLRWKDLVLREDPDIIIGYNIFGFDYEFLFRRAEETRCVDEFLQMSRKHGEFCGKRDKFDSSAIEIEHTKIAIASGEYDLRYINMGGRLQVDMYNYFRRNFNLSSYKLDDVASQNISDDISKVVNSVVTNNEVTELHTKNITGLHVGDFIHIELSSFTSDYYMSGKKFAVIDIMNTSTGTAGKILIIAGHHEHLIDKTKKIRWNMTKDDVSVQDIFRMSNGTDVERAIVAKYCIQDCNLVHHLMRKIDVLTEYMEMANLCSVPVNFLVFRGQGIKLTSFVAKKCMEKGYLMPDLEKGGMDGGYEGAIVLPPKTKIYIDEPVACVDYSSLYPSSMISQNYCHSSKVWAKEYDLSGKLVKEEGERDKKGNYIYYGLPDYQYVEIEFDTFEWRRNPERPAAKAQKTKVGKRVVCWAQMPNDEKSVMPSILMELLKAREDTKKKAKKASATDPFMANILDKRQLAYKVTANSLYGQCGARTSTFYEKDVAASTTASGRMSITYARRIIEEIYDNRICKTEKHGMVMTNAEYVYGDSVTSYTPIYVRYCGFLHIMRISDLSEKYGENGWRFCEEPGRQTKEVCEMREGVETWTEKGWTRLHRVIRHALAPHKNIMRIQTATGCVDVTDDHSLILKSGEEVSPKDVGLMTELLHCDIDHETFAYNKTREYLSAHKYLDEFTNNVNTIVVNDCIEAAYAYLFLRQRGYHVKQKTRGTNKMSYTLTYSTTPFDNMFIQEIETLSGYNGHVYDLTTENHHFAAGIGNMIVHNTDSVFFIFNLTNKDTGEKIVGKDALEITIELAQEAAHYSSMFLKPPMNLAYEKTLMPFALLSKKRYVGILYEEDPNKGKLKYMGLSLKRRDSCDYLKDTYGQIINLVMKGGNVMDAIKYLDTSLTALIAGAVPTDKLEITKALRGYYKNPQQIAHCVLANRIGQRDPGNKPKAGDRMRFIHVTNANKKALQGEKIETPEYIIQAKLKIDYDFYITNQLLKPICQFMGLALEQIWKQQGKLNAIKKYKEELAQIEKEYPDFELFIKKKEKYCSEKVKALLFDKYLLQIKNDKTGNQPITNFFGMKK
jgi:DNA polymerase elongation subunit (family B)